MIKLFILTSGQFIVADEENRDGKRLWKTPLLLDFGTKIEFKSLFHYTKNNEFYPRSTNILIEDEVTLQMARQYRFSVERLVASKAGLVIPELKPPEPNKLVKPGN